MPLKELDLRPAYDSDSDDILNDFLIPALSVSKRYMRLAGFFSSSSLAVAARGVAQLIVHGGRMQLVAGAKLSRSDASAVNDALGRSDSDSAQLALGGILTRDLETIENDFVRDHVRALGWMVKNKLLDIRVAILLDSDGTVTPDSDSKYSAIFHQKIGILEDEEGNMVSFSGSVNETAYAWTMENVEEFKVFRSWEESERKFLDADLRRFSKYWEGSPHRVRVLSIPDATRERLIQFAPEKEEDLALEKWRRRPTVVSKRRQPFELWDTQKQAVREWLANEDPATGRIFGLFEMATGTGKTFAALGCARELLGKLDGMLIVISCPYTHLVTQWLDDIKEFGIPGDTIEADSENPKWRDEAADRLVELNAGVSKNLTMVTTHDTLCSTDFQKLIVRAQVKILLIADEVHWLGAPILSTGLSEVFHYRLGLSATPRRHFDEEGTSKIFDYFGRTVYSFPLEKAIVTPIPGTDTTYLVPYEYRPVFVEMNDDEMNKYQELTEKIAHSFFTSGSEEEKKDLFTILCERRAEIVKDAEAKYDAFSELISKLGRNLAYTLVYVTPEQIDRVQDILNSKGILQRKFTFRESGRTRQEILAGFENQDYEVVVAMHCLDEGMDIKPARTAIIMASTGNPREYIQRRGRILRNSKGKLKAVVYDFIVLPQIAGTTDQELLKLEKKILAGEFKRFKEFATPAMNSIECLGQLVDMQRKYDVIL